MKVLTMRKGHGIYVAVLAVFLMSLLLMTLININRVNAGTFTARSIKMSSSVPGATSVTYELTVTPAVTVGASGLVIEFCDNSPLDTDTCTATAGTNVPDAGSAALSGWTLDGSSDGNTVKFTNAGDVTFTATTPITLTVTGITNPSNVGGSGAGEFYARVYNYDLSATAQAYTSAAPGSYTDFGGFALSTAAQINITAKVMEKLRFCVWRDPAGGSEDCSTGYSNQTLGDSRGALDETATYTNAEAKFDVLTNAQGGVVVRAKTFGAGGAQANNTLTSGSNYITEIGGTAAQRTVGSEQFGFCVGTSGGSVVGVAPYSHASCSTLPVNGTYDGTGNVTFALDINGTTGVSSTFGDDIASINTATANTTGTLGFIGNISPTTEAGIYTFAMSLIATSTF
jgi:hypothetical protein